MHNSCTNIIFVVCVFDCARDIEIIMSSHLEGVDKRFSYTADFQSNTETFVN